MAQRTIKFSPPDIGQAEIDEVVDTLRSKNSRGVSPHFAVRPRRCVSIPQRRGWS